MFTAIYKDNNHLSQFETEELLAGRIVHKDISEEVAKGYIIYISNNGKSFDAAHVVISLGEYSEFSLTFISNYYEFYIQYETKTPVHIARDFVRCFRNAALLHMLMVRDNIRSSMSFDSDLSDVNISLYPGEHRILISYGNDKILVFPEFAIEVANMIEDLINSIIKTTNYPKHE